MKKTNFRARVMKYAWQIRKSTNRSMRFCLFKAWQLYKLALSMRKGVVGFSYKKVDGSFRKAFGTLVNIPAGATFGGKRLTKPSYRTLSYFDIERQSFRSFRAENLIAID